MTNIEFTQFLMPRGEPSKVFIDRPDEVAAKAAVIRERGFAFECEMLSDYQTISLTIADHRKGEDVDIEVVPNGPEVPDAIDRMIDRFHARLLKRRAKAAN